MLLHGLYFPVLRGAGSIAITTTPLERSTPLFFFFPSERRACLTAPPGWVLKTLSGSEPSYWVHSTEEQQHFRQPNFPTNPSSRVGFLTSAVLVLCLHTPGYRVDMRWMLVSCLAWAVTAQVGTNTGGLRGGSPPAVPNGPGLMASATFIGFNTFVSRGCFSGGVGSVQYT